jgi:hypothetical protein
VAATEAQLGPVDVLINNAGWDVFKPPGSMIRLERSVGTCCGLKTWNGSCVRLRTRQRGAHWRAGHGQARSGKRPRDIWPHTARVPMAAELAVLEKYLGRLAGLT